jgi:hypothetical protein
MTEPGSDELLLAHGNPSYVTDGVRAENERLAAEESHVRQTPPAEDEPGRQYPVVDEAPD